MPETMNGTPLTMPEGVQVESMTPTYGRFVVQPLERGYGVTMSSVRSPGRGIANATSS